MECWGLGGVGEVAYILTTSAAFNWFISCQKGMFLIPF